MHRPPLIGGYFGEPWPSSVCDDGIQVDTPVGEPCELCGEPIEANHQGSFMGTMMGEEGVWIPRLCPVHRECSLRSVLGGIGHLTNHRHWCHDEHDSDAGLSFRESSILVWGWVQDNGFYRQGSG